MYLQVKREHRAELELAAEGVYIASKFGNSWRFFKMIWGDSHLSNLRPSDGHFLGDEWKDVIFFSTLCFHSKHLHSELYQPLCILIIREINSAI